MPVAIHEIVKQVAEAKGKSAKIDLLTSFSKSVAVQAIFKMAYDKNIKILLPDCAPPFNRKPDIGGQGIMYNEAPKMLKIYTNSGLYPNLSIVRREELFISLLEDIDGSDADMLIKVIERKGFPGISGSVVKAVFPEIDPI